MTYREQLNKVNELGISICDLEVANELDAVLDFDYTEDEFDEVTFITQKDGHIVIFTERR